MRLAGGFRSTDLRLQSAFLSLCRRRFAGFLGPESLVSASICHLERRHAVTTERVSIVTPSYNHAQFIERTVRSVVQQNYRNIEYIIMDGGSRDGTLRILEPYEDRISQLVSEKDDGQADAIAKGFLRSTGGIMAYLNSDDVLGPGTVEFVVSFFREHPQIDAIYSHRIGIDPDDRVIWYWILPAHHNYLMKRWDLIPQETCFWRRSLWERAGNVDKTFRFAMDYDLFVRFMNRGRFHRVNRFLGAFRWHPEAKSTQLLATTGRDEIARIWAKYGLRQKLYSKAIERWFSNTTNARGAAFARSGRTLPGSKPGLGYSYDEVWGGVLTSRPLL
jgi:glycosyltransferase involved in cell wall biosynthesis